MVNNIKSEIVWTLVEWEDWKLYIAATAEGLCYVSPHDQAFAEITKWIRKHFTDSTMIIRDDERLRPYTSELTDYLRGERKSFSLPFDFHGTNFQKSVWTALNSIPYGQTKTYSAIAEQIGKPSAVRAVGTAIGANPILIAVPCHRVIGKNGALTGYRGGLEMKSRLLALEFPSNESQEHPAIE